MVVVVVMVTVAVGAGCNLGVPHSKDLGELIKQLQKWWGRAKAHK